MDVERQRLGANLAHWRRFGPYLSERAWGTVREDYSDNGDAWGSFPHDHARSRAYRWNEDGLAGFCDDQQIVCMALALWNGADPILKERLFGLSGPEGNHGEDVKENYWYLDGLPSHAWMRMLYRYPQRAYPYAELVEGGRTRSRNDPELELDDTGIFEGNRFFDIETAWAKVSPTDLLLRVRVHNAGPVAAPLHVLPSLWFRNTWAWAAAAEAPAGCEVERPLVFAAAGHPAGLALTAPGLGKGFVATLPAEITGADGAVYATVDARMLFTDNETNNERLFGTASRSRFTKDAFHRHLVEGEADAVNPNLEGSKAALHYELLIPPGGGATLRVRLTFSGAAPEPLTAASFDALCQSREAEADAFYAAIHPAALVPDERRIQRQAWSGLLWSKQFYHYDVRTWLDGDSAQPPPSDGRRHQRNHGWRHFDARDVISMPDCWEYPWFATWDLAFHCVALARLDPDLAKSQLLLLCREWYMHPNGALPAYEWSFDDANPPVLAWAALRVFEIEREVCGQEDVEFLRRIFHKMLIHFTWWVNRKDSEGNNVFEGGFLGLDNVAVFDRSQGLPSGGRLEQSDATSWMGFFSLSMLLLALEIASRDRSFEDIATKFFEHFLAIAEAMARHGESGIALWNEEDELFYDVLRLPDGQAMPLRVQSIVTLIPLFATLTIKAGMLAGVPAFRERLEWVLENRPELASLVSRWKVPGVGERQLLALVRGHRMKCVLRRALDEAGFLSPYGIRSLSRHHRDHPWGLDLDGQHWSINYEPGESRSGLYGGNSNWRGPVWMPINFLLVGTLRRFQVYYGNDFRIESPTGSGRFLSFDEIADDIAARLIALFRPGPDGMVPSLGGPAPKSVFEPILLLFHEYFHGDTGKGLGASHQTGWTALVAELLQTKGRRADVLKHLTPTAEGTPSAQ